MKKFSSILNIAFFFTLLFSTAIHAQNNISAGTPVVAQRVTTGKISSQILTSGDVLPMQGVDLHPETSGLIIDIKVSEGSKVKKGDTLAIIDHAVQQAGYIQAEAAVEVAKAGVEMEKVMIQSSLSRLTSAKAQKASIVAQMKNLRTTKERMEQLFKEGAISRQQLDDVIANHDATEAQLVAAEAAIQQANDAVLSSKMTKKMKEAQLIQASANLNSAKVILENAYIIAPFDGIITRRDADPGAMANPAKPILRLEQMNPVKILGSLIEKDLHMINPEKTVAIVSLDTIEKDFKSKVKKIYPSINSVSRTGKLEIQLDNPDLQLRSGMFAHIKLLIETKSNVVIVPRDSLMSYKSNLYAFKVENGKARKVMVKTGLVQGSIIEITAGLKAGDIIISEGLEFIREGSQVKVILEEDGK